MITTTTDHIEGYRITEYRGVVFADARMTIHDFNEPQRWTPFPQNADAVIGIQYERSGDSAHLIGTAVKIEKV